jgi:hypothetical protein
MRVPCGRRHADGGMRTAACGWRHADIGMRTAACGWRRADGGCGWRHVGWACGLDPSFSGSEGSEWCSGWARDDPFALEMQNSTLMWVCDVYVSWALWPGRQWLSQSVWARAGPPSISSICVARSGAGGANPARAVTLSRANLQPTAYRGTASRALTAQATLLLQLHIRRPMRPIKSRVVLGKCAWWPPCGGIVHTELGEP